MRTRKIFQRPVVDHLRVALADYETEVERTSLGRQTKNARIYNVKLFLQWPEGKYDPSSET